MITQLEFARRTVGIPWVRRREDYQACDCYGLVLMYFRDVIGVSLPSVTTHSVSNGFADQRSIWRSVDRSTSHIFVAVTAGEETHCGIVLSDGRLLHCYGSENLSGNVRIDRADAVAKIFGDLKYYAYNSI